MDAQIFEDCGLKEAIEQRVIGFPPPDHLPDDDSGTPCFFVGDNAFPLHTYMLKPYGRLGLEVPEKNTTIKRAIAEESARMPWYPGWPTDMPVY